MRLVIFILLLTLIIGCDKSIPTSGDQETPACYQRDPRWVLASEVYHNEIGKKVFYQLKKEKNLHVCESGWGLYGKEKIQVMHCAFNYYNELNINEARELLLTAANLYLKTINENERIRPSLGFFPFKPENIELRIFIYEPNKSFPPDEKLQIIRVIRGKLVYDNNMPGTKFLNTVHKETYEEAMEKLTSM